MPQHAIVVIQRETAVPDVARIWYESDVDTVQTEFSTALAGSNNDERLDDVDEGAPLLYTELLSDGDTGGRNFLIGVATGYRLTLIDDGVFIDTWSLSSYWQRAAPQISLLNGVRSWSRRPACIVTRPPAT